MGKTLRIVVAGGPETGKTSMLERLIYNNYDPDKKMYPTKEDIFLGQVDIRNRRELLRIHDTSGKFFRVQNSFLPKKFLGSILNINNFLHVYY